MQLHCHVQSICSRQQAGVAVVSQIGANAGSVAEMAIGLVLSISRRIAESGRKMRSGRGYSRESLMGHDLADKILGLVGNGYAGTATAKLAKLSACGFWLTTPTSTRPPSGIAARSLRDLVAVLAQSDIVSLHCPRNAQTLGMFGAEQYAAMKPGTLFISTARDGIHDEDALARALESGRLAGAGLDVSSRASTRTS